MLTVIIALITASVAGGVYKVTLSPFLPIGDGAELITVSYIKGLAHSPGYPLLTLLGNLFLQLPLNLSIPQQANLLSMIFSTVSIFFIFLALYLLVKIYFPETKRLVVYALSGSLALAIAFSYQFWLSAVQFEVFALHNLFISLILFFTFFIHYQIINGKNAYLQKLVLAFIIGLSLTNNYTIIVFIAGSLIYLYLFSNKKIDKYHLAAYILLFLAGLTPYIYIYLKVQEAISTGFIPHSTLEEFLRIVLRMDFGTFSALKESTGHSTRGLFEILIQRIIIDIAFIGIIPLFIGLWYGLKTKYIQAFLITAITLQLGIYFRLNLPTYSSFGTGTAERFFTNAMILCVILIALGVGFVFTKIKENHIAPSSFLLFLMPLYLIIFNNNQISSQNTNAGELLGEYILSKIPENSLVMTYSDINFYTLTYLINAEGKRTDVEIFPYKLLNANSPLEKTGFDMYLLETIKNKGKDHVIIVDYPGDFTYEQTGKVYRKVPFGITDQVKDFKYIGGDDVFQSGMQLITDYKTVFFPSTKNLPEFSTANAINALFLNQINWHGVYLFLEGHIGMADTIYQEVLPLIEELPQSNPKITAEIYKNAGTIRIRRGDKGGTLLLQKSLELDPGQQQADILKSVIQTYQE